MIYRFVAAVALVANCSTAQEARWGHKKIPRRRDAGDCLICNRDRVRHRTVVTKSFARG